MSFRAWQCEELIKHLSVNEEWSPRHGERLFLRLCTCKHGVMGMLYFIDGWFRKQLVRPAVSCFRTKRDDWGWWHCDESKCGSWERPDAVPCGVVADLRHVIGDYSRQYYCEIAFLFVNRDRRPRFEKAL